MELDAKDRLILLELDNDATVGLKKIARKLRTTKEAVAYRIRQLEEKKIISNYIALSHFTKLGLTHYKLYIKYSHISAEKKKEIIDFIMIYFRSEENHIELYSIVAFHEAGADTL